MRPYASVGCELLRRSILGHFLASSSTRHWRYFTHPSTNTIAGAQPNKPWHAGNAARQLQLVVKESGGKTQENFRPTQKLKKLPKTEKSSKNVQKVDKNVQKFRNTGAMTVLRAASGALHAINLRACVLHGHKDVRD